MMYCDRIKVMIRDIIIEIENHFPDVTLSMFILRCDYETYDGLIEYGDITQY